MGKKITFTLNNHINCKNFEVVVSRSGKVQKELGGETAWIFLGEEWKEVKRSGKGRKGLRITYLPIKKRKHLEARVLWEQFR